MTQIKGAVAAVALAVAAVAGAGTAGRFSPISDSTVAFPCTIRR
jgi:hypothetical protein